MTSNLINIIRGLFRPRTRDEIRRERLQRWGAPPLPSDWSEEQVRCYYENWLIVKGCWLDVSEAEAVDAIHNYCVRHKYEDGLFERLICEQTQARDE